MGVLGVARFDWLTWISHIWPFALVSAWLLHAMASDGRGTVASKPGPDRLHHPATVALEPFP